MLPKARRERMSEVLLHFRRRAARPIPTSLVHVCTAESCTPPEVPDYSLVATVRNEERGIEAWLQSLAALQHQPKQLIIVDAGSTDRTVQAIERWRATVTGCIEVDCIIEPGASIARGRNLATMRATSDCVAFTDAGCRVDPMWANRLLAPFSVFPRCTFSMGWYSPVARTPFARAARYYLVPQLPSVDPAVFLPSARSLAVRAEMLRATGGFPEFLSDAGEDSLFDVYLKSQAEEGAFVPDALVYWEMPQTARELFRTVHRYARGDAEGGRVAWEYYLNLLEAWAGICGDAGLAATVLVLRFVFPWPVLTWVSLALSAVALFRFVQMLRAYPSATDPSTGARLGARAAVAVMTVGQALGFCSGLLARRAVEQRRRLAAVDRHTVLIVPRSYRRGDREHPVQVALDRGESVTAVVVAPLKNGEVPVEHPRLDVYQRSGFSAPLWLAHHGVHLQRANIPIRVVDMVEDSVSRQITQQLVEAVGGAGRSAHSL